MVAARAAAQPPVPGQEIHFARSADGVSLAWARHGSGPPLVVASCWLSHLQHDWQSPVWRHFLDALGAISTVVRYDERGFGMSDWNVTDFSIDARVHDLETVVDAAGLGRFAMLGMSGGSAVAMAYAGRHPERVSRLVLYGTVSGAPIELSGERLEREQTFRQLIRVGWAIEDPVFRRVFTGIYIPGATESQMGWFDALQRMATSASNAVTSRIARQEADVRGEQAAIRAPTLIVQARGDRATPFVEGVEAAGRIPGARLVALESRNHILLADEPAWPRFLAELEAFLEPEERRSAPVGDAAAAGGRSLPPLVESLSTRELEVLSLAAEGLANDQIAGSLGISHRTVERHLTNAYGKLGVSGKAARAAAVASMVRRRLG